MSAVAIHDARKVFGEHVAVESLSLEVPQGSLCGFLGPNGAGKSTTIRMIMSIIYPDSGSIDVLGSSALKNKDRIGYLPEERGVYRKMKVAEFIRFIAKLKGVDRPGFDRVVTEWLERIELPGVEKKKCEELSKGMQQKVQFLAAVINDPDLIILDEPFSGLDPVNAEVLNRLVGELHAEGRTIIFSTHILQQAEKLCDRIVLIDRGRKLLDDDMPAIRERFEPRELAIEPGQDAVAAEIAAAVEAMPGVDGARIDDRVVLASLADATDPRPMMREMLDRLPLDGVRVRQMDLEEIFVSLVRRDRGAEAADEARLELMRN